MNTEDIRLLYRYNAWANMRILNAAALVPGAQFLAPAGFPHGGLRSTLTHILFAEWVWRKRWEGDSPTTMIEPEDFPTFEAIRDRWRNEDESLDALLDNINDARLNTELEYKSTKGEPKRNVLWQLMAHLVNHGTQHRTEAAALLTDMGHSPGDIDLILFLREG